MREVHQEEKTNILEDDIKDGINTKREPNKG